jgi:hypothetical protein
VLTIHQYMWGVVTELLGDRTSLFSVLLKVLSCSFIWCSACCCWCGDLLLIGFSFLFSFFSTSSPINARLFSFCLLFQFQFLFFYFLFFWSFDRSLFFFFISVLQFQYEVLIALISNFFLGSFVKFFLFSI